MVRCCSRYSINFIIVALSSVEGASQCSGRRWKRKVRQVRLKSSKKTKNWTAVRPTFLNGRKTMCDPAFPHSVQENMKTSGSGGGVIEHRTVELKAKLFAKVEIGEWPAQKLYCEDVDEQNEKFDLLQLSAEHQNEVFSTTSYWKRWIDWYGINLRAPWIALNAVNQSKIAVIYALFTPTFLCVMHNWAQEKTLKKRLILVSWNESEG